MLNTGPSQVVQGLASYQEMCDVYLLYWVQVQTCLFISTNIYIYIYLLLHSTSYLHYIIFLVVFELIFPYVFCR